MKAYVTTSGSIFGLVTLAHVLRMFAEGSHVLHDPWFVVLTLVSAGLCGWAVRLLGLTARS
jgi:hypothetical protein